jgi:cobalamin biosynthesis Mg chelatase CobN
VLDRLVEMYETAPPRTFVKEPIVAYLDRASQQEGEIGTEAKAALAKLEEQDPETVKRARSLLAYGFLSRARGGAGDGTPTGGAPASDPTYASTMTKSPQADSDEADGTAEDIELPPPTAPAESPAVANETTPATTPQESTSVAQEPALPQEGEATTDVAPAKPAEPSQQASTPTAAESVRETAPPSPVLMVALPLLAVVGFMGLVWVILRGGV